MLAWHEWLFEGESAAILPSFFIFCQMHIAVRHQLLFWLACAAPWAEAQSSVVLYGNIDLGISKRSGNPLALERGYNNWLGIKGSEALGGGLSATFHLQTRFNPDTGSLERNSTFWQGESTVGMASETHGTLRLGRALTPLWNNVWRFEPWLNSGFNGSLAAFQTGSYSSDGLKDTATDYANFSRISNGLFYESPTFGGWSLDAAGETERLAGAAKRTSGVSLNYARGAVEAMASYESNRIRDRIMLIAASWRLDKLTLMASHARVHLNQGDTEKAVMLAGTYKLGKDTVRAGYGRNADRHSSKLSMGYIHALSVRTNIYADLYRDREPDFGSAVGAALGISHTF
ncbi:porin [Noviherbaspirillum soli]|uniref:porin n=1 Tax=Noviherbaspirillum soli TaxID=1064518 RepID=UPI001E63EBAD|nr:porin [Noviherbaspirillum soli]